MLAHSLPKKAKSPWNWRHFVLKSSLCESFTQVSQAQTKRSKCVDGSPALESPSGLLLLKAGVGDLPTAEESTSFLRPLSVSSNI